MSDLNRRLISGTIIGVLVTCLIIFALHPIFQYVVVVSVAAMAGVAIWEYEQFVKAKGWKMTTPALIILSVCEVLAFFFFAKDAVFKGLPIAVFFAGFLILFAMHFREKEGAIVNLAVSAFGLAYIAVPVGMILGILYFPHDDGRLWIAYLLVVTKVTDMGAYFGGNLWGKRQLAPRISPKKTVEGAVCGLVCAVLASFVFYLVGESTRSFEWSGFTWLFLGLTLGIVGQLGDLSESLLKRDAQKKDSNALPGLGGVLDSIDSIIFNATIIFVYLYYVNL
ncbi:MAG: hypothetical protein A3D96_01320 [Chlamydiae bacterium RIFCSPHIGHO2_12_FULL_44_59]|nr:MAG: hypothetical protein A2796_00895 [Chlamydiae bacterium RIFCSPHIGHO2_01_FULL_44_39]OGN58869.1 MAG: hypothetical protein A3C42_05015 [Chlamydiae bacterium RIFCSPHIGHO2_02_FULL_45_9]OGN60504.1 MAG: hypothetical protein A3D96_01320 [Chlamydiae bacterium RIFCSPHIGHO2_12_FULL_44_59]OGN65958.1 MAG: hypothetical protein A2978_04610 [Chlamydiae bacterium RIFCSPLOWO2_01_FULL_44_52]OGN68773.1 MAG: hypothetical protein A3I67_00270 [Chlamydiae bacterium RIFCSPLOWO2_02_FULL_45_22]OGN70414.1 MAG: hyp